MADGKRALVAPPVGDEDDAQMVTTIQESRWLAGVTRQAQPTAQLHQQAASQAAAAKRKEQASFTAAEAKRRRADHMKEVRAQQKAERVAAVSAAAAAAAAPRVPDGYSTGLDRRFYGETVTLISTREIQDSERTSTQSKQFVRNDDTN